jgi:hypothetical protein
VVLLDRDVLWAGRYCVGLAIEAQLSVEIPRIMLSANQFRLNCRKPDMLTVPPTSIARFTATPCRSTKSCSSHTIAPSVRCRCHDQASDDGTGTRTDRPNRRLSLALACGLALMTFPPAYARERSDADVHDEFASQAMKAYNNNDLETSYVIYSNIIELDPTNPVWRERRGQVLVDLKRFTAALRDFDDAEAMYRTTVSPNYISLGLLSNRALAYEGLYRWKDAIAGYDEVRTDSLRTTKALEDVLIKFLIISFCIHLMMCAFDG